MIYKTGILFNLTFKNEYRLLRKKNFVIENKKFYRDHARTFILLCRFLDYCVDWFTEIF